MPIDKSLLQNLRENYQAQTLDIQDVLPDPLQQFGRWFKEALASELPEPNAMILATCNANGRPSARTMLLKEVDANGFVFYTNYESRKGKELISNPFASLVFLWLELQRQVRIEGRIEKVSPSDSREYFQSRPRESQIGAWTSPQSKVITSREWLEERFKQFQHQFSQEPVLPLPMHWGGFRLVPDTIEFWQGRPSRLHDRIRYQQKEDGHWILERLAP